MTNFLPSSYVDSVLICVLSLLFLLFFFIHNLFSLPSAAYLKLSDIWFLGIIGINLTQILLLLRMNNLSIQLDACYEKMRMVYKKTIGPIEFRKQSVDDSLAPVEMMENSSMKIDQQVKLFLLS